MLAGKDVDIAPRSSGMLYLICERAKPVRRSSPIVVYIDLRAGGGGGGGGSGQRETPTGYAPALCGLDHCGELLSANIRIAHS